MASYKVSLIHPATRLIYATVRLQRLDAKGADDGSGTAFFFGDFDSPGRPAYLVTNKHVLESASAVRALFHTGEMIDKQSFAPDAEEWLEWPTSAPWRLHPDSDVDLAAVPVAELKNHAAGSLDRLFHTVVWSVWCPKPEVEAQFPAMLATTMVGYPAGLWDAHNNLPILRRGTTASHPAIDYGGRAELMVDIAAIPGSSGSPVLVIAEGKPEIFLGVLYAGPTDIAEGKIVFSHIPTLSSTPVVQTEIGIHLGLAIKAKVLLDFVRSL